ncbi:nitrate- and nitrite sensing domain-containing protein [[Kitasatospora] papulosa]|uniref:sensor histidine kinase n=1 Tax=Streptomyces TaxID=1883 RepID=UPI0004BD54DC|nr:MULTISPECIES: nitrate- and nitrite sensing domain-containing protein [Streptomyces]MDF9870150.1 signal transduction histidine kinase [Streptomyces pratensis]MYT61673.1 HAMP domain-containing protein [Streptomyces sp. SID7834]MCX4412070.1 nitrate- and nitrite sensing domain-containing protein [[Kitasatospora] papulosa]MCY1679110.1 nitrate- and nitrite sensing domain-containing protein [Streptomyces sp. SL294]MDX2618487.1 nitrate- and nitrite sensing domain-containing protein [Streptomyces sp
MQKKRPRSKDSTREESGAAPQAAGASKRTVRVRSRLVAGVAVVGITVIAAGAPAALGASSDLNESQRLVTLAELNQQAITLAHSLADERDEVTAHIAGGREEGDGKDGTTSPAARVDQQVDEILEAAPAALRRDLSAIPSLRRTALTGKGSAMEAYQAYSEVIAKLHDLADELAEKTPPRAADATRAPLALGTAVEQASATRGLLLAALAVPGTEPQQQTDPFTGLPVQGQDSGDSEGDRTRDELSAAAQQARVRELASLAEFDQAAGPSARDSLASTVTGPEVTGAEKYLTRLTDRPELSDSDREADPKKVEAALSARIDRMRGVESALGTAQVKRLEALRDDDVTALELRLALLGGCLLVAVGVSTAVARTLTQPLAVLRIGAGRIAAEPETAEPIRYTGRNDEFAQVVRSINALHGKLHGLQHDVTGRLGSVQSEHGEPAADREALTLQRAELQTRVAELTGQLERLRNTVHHTFVNLSLRTLGLVERQLGVIEGMEEREQDPERLATLFKLDHMATVMRRHSENMLVLAGTDHNQGHVGPIPLVDVLRAAVSEIERYERVTIQSLPPHARIAGFAADDVSHLVAELLENATSFSPPDSHVELSGWLLETGEVMLSVQDAGIGMSAVRMGELNARLADPATFEAGEQAADGAGLGLQVISLLAARHGVQVQLREQKGSGVTAVVVLPQALLPKVPPVSSPPSVALPGDAPALNLPGSVAEANSNALPTRSALPGADPLIEAAERTLQQAGPQPTPAQSGTPEPAAPGPEPVAPESATPQPPAAPETDPSGEPAHHEESEAETTMQVRLPVQPDAPSPYAIGPDRHERAADTSPATDPAPASAPAADALPGPRQPLTGLGEEVPDPAPVPERLTDKGLPKRTPRISEPQATAPTERKGSLDKEALRRRLGGFHQGAKDGRRDVETEISDSGPQTDHDRTDGRIDETGDTVEEARS